MQQGGRVLALLRAQLLRAVVAQDYSPHEGEEARKEAEDDVLRAQHARPGRLCIFALHRLRGGAGILLAAELRLLVHDGRAADYLCLLHDSGGHNPEAARVLLQLLQQDRDIVRSSRRASVRRVHLPVRRDSVRRHNRNRHLGLRGRRDGRLYWRHGPVLHDQRDADYDVPARYGAARCRGGGGGGGPYHGL